MANSSHSYFIGAWHRELELGAIPHRLAGADTDGGTLLTRGYARNAVQGSDSA